MTIKEANENLKAIAGSRASAIQMEIMNYPYDGHKRITCKAYIADGPGWTAEHATFEDALCAVAQALNGIEHPERVESMLASEDVSDEAA